MNQVGGHFQNMLRILFRFYRHRVQRNKVLLLFVDMPDDYSCEFNISSSVVKFLLLSG